MLFTPLGHATRTIRSPVWSTPFWAFNNLIASFWLVVLTFEILTLWTSTRYMSLTIRAEGATPSSYFCQPSRVCFLSPSLTCTSTSPLRSFRTPTIPASLSLSASLPNIVLFDVVYNAVRSLASSTRTLTCQSVTSSCEGGGGLDAIEAYVERVVDVVVVGVEEVRAVCSRAISFLIRCAASYVCSA